MRRCRFVVVLVLSAATALIAVVGSSAMPINKHSVYALWICPDGIHETVLNWESGHKISFWTADDTPVRLQSFDAEEEWQFVMASGPVVSESFFNSDELAQGDGFANKLVGPCAADLFLSSWDGMVGDWEIGLFPALSSFYGQQYTGTVTLSLRDAVFLIPH